MKSLVLFSIFTIIFQVQAQSIKEVDLFNVGSLKESTEFSEKIFVAITKAAKARNIGKIKAILRNIPLEDNSYFLLMTEDKKFREIWYDKNKDSIILPPDDYVMTKDNINCFTASGWINYFIRDPDHRIPNDISNNKNSFREPD